MPDKTFSVLVFDMARSGEPDGERRVDGFADFAAARAYAEARLCHDIKFGSTARGVFAWPEKPEGEALHQMQAVLMADSLAIRGDGPDWVDMCEADEPRISETQESPTYG